MESKGTIIILAMSSMPLDSEISRAAICLQFRRPSETHLSKRGRTRTEAERRASKGARGADGRVRDRARGQDDVLQTLIWN